MATIIDESLKQVPLPKNTMVVAREDGRLYVVDFTESPHLDDPGAVDWNVSVSKMIVGKIQMTRTRAVSLEELEIENILRTGQFPPDTTSDLEVTVFGATDGKNPDIVFTPHLAYEDGQLAKYTCRATAQNFSIQLRGSYNVNTFTVTLHNHGRR